MVGILFLVLICSQIPSSIQKINSTIAKQYEKLICENEATCSWLSKYQLPEDWSTLKRRNCMCDEECVLYKDCCPDSPYYDDVEQRGPSEFYCPRIEKVYMKVYCASSWPSDHVNDQCIKSTKALDSDNVWVLVPVTNPKNGTTYGNLYCAICNYDRDYEVWDLKPSCAESSVQSSRTPQNQFKNNDEPNLVQNTPKNSKNSDLVAERTHSRQSPFSKSSAPQQNNIPGPVRELVSKPSYTRPLAENEAFGHSGTQEQNGNGLFFRPSVIDPKNILNIFVYGNRNPLVNRGAEINTNFYGDLIRRKRQTGVGLDFNKYVEQTPEIWKNVMFDPTTKQLRSEYKGKSFECAFEVKVPSFLQSQTRPCVPKLIVKCKDESDPAVAKACRSSTMIVWNKVTKQSYRNKACALCNGEKESDLTPCPPGGRTELSNNFKSGSEGIGEDVPCDPNKLNCSM